MTDDDFDQALLTLYPDVPPDSGSLARARARVLEAAAPVGPAPRRQRWWPQLTAAAAAAVMIAVVAATALHRDGPPPAAPRAGPMVEVAQTLNAAADAEIRTVDVTVPPGQFRYIATHAVSLAQSETQGRMVAVLEGRRTEIWVPADRGQEWFLRETDTGERTRLVGTAADARAAGLDEGVRPPTELRARCGDWYPGPAQRPCEIEGNWQGPNDKFVADLPRTPEALLAELRKETRGRGNDADQEVLVYVADALRSGLLPGDLRAALYRTLALLPGITITERTATLDGRTGTAFGITAAGTTQDIVIDQKTGDFIGERTRTVETMDRMPAGTVIDSTSVSYGVGPVAGAPPRR